MRRIADRRRSAAALASLGLLLTLVACGSDEPEPIPPAPSSEASSTAEPSASPTETEDADGAPTGWEDEFSDRQLRAYEAALARWERYRIDAVPIYAKGRNTSAARRVLKGTDLRWRQQVRVLAGIEQAGLQQVTGPEPLWAKANSVELDRDGTGTVTIAQCTDYTDMRWERRGKPEKGLKPKTLTTPLVVRMDKREAQGNWMVVETQLKGMKSCAT